MTTTNAISHMSSKSVRNAILVVCSLSLMLNAGFYYIYFIMPFSETSATFASTELKGSNDLHHTYFDTDREKVLDSWIKNAKGLVSKIQSKQNPKQKPFIFFHVRKAAGSSLRYVISRSASMNNFTHWIPCFHPRACKPFTSPPSNKLHEVYGSHVNYMEISHVLLDLSFAHNGRSETIQKKMKTLKLENKTAKIYEFDYKEPEFNCLTNLRETVKRVVSCWNYRMTRTAPNFFQIPTANQMTPKDWETLLPTAYDFYSSGCNNELARIFGSLDEVEVNKLNSDTPGFLHEFELIASRMSKCVIIIAERCEESNSVVRHYLPWVEVNLCETHHNSAKTTDNKVLQENASEAILSQNMIDEMLFKLGEALFEEQIQAALNASNT